VATTALTRDFVEIVAGEIAQAVECAMELWMAEFESALENRQLTTLGRLQAVRDIVDTYKRHTGNKHLRLIPTGAGGRQQKHEQEVAELLKG
jgi:hypothetical protein